MPRGRKPKPTNLKVLQGTFRPDRANKNEPKPDPGIPEPPECLSPVALEKWKAITPELEVLGLLTQIDGDAIARYCQHYAIWVEAMTQLQKTGLVVRTKEGNPIQSPYLGIANRANDILAKLEAEFGMTPSSRGRIGVGPKGGESKFKGVIGGKKG